VHLLSFLLVLLIIRNGWYRAITPFTAKAFDLAAEQVTQQQVGKQGQMLVAAGLVIAMFYLQQQLRGAYELMWLAVAILTLSVIYCHIKIRPELWQGTPLALSISKLWGPVVWFVLLGPAGALGFHLLEYIEKRHPEKGYSNIYLWVSWLPCRVGAYFFALAGHYSLAFDSLKRFWSIHYMDPVEILCEVGEEALCAHLNEKGCAKALIKRSISLFILVLAVLTIGGLIR
tara:strand:- start:1971 stop:2660 length:690 start_codon:yes stop_codon:yes gene_type:complete